MVRKFLTWRTNKHELNPNFLNFVVYSIDDNANRKDPLKRAVTFTNDQNNMWELLESADDAESSPCEIICLDTLNESKNSFLNEQDLVLDT